jgi:3-deoxy-manno-octulosonate cytidylyltransferase (CMP-KDO synthetase)
MKIIGLIPARYGSSRFPGKPLADIAGQTMIQRVLNRVHEARIFSQVCVATDDQRIFDHVNDLGYEAVMTATSHQSGTDRCAEALTIMNSQADAVINIQGDEPFVHPSQLQTLAELIALSHVGIATLIKPISDPLQLNDANKVKVVRALDGRALYFSRQAIPFQRDKSPEEWLSPITYYKHLGLYAYKTSVLKELVKLPLSDLEKAEALEQLRWLENGHAIYTGVSNLETPAIDTPEDLLALLANWPETL